MTARSELLREEIQRVTQAAGYYVTPERLAELMGRAQKVMTVLCGGRISLSYADCDIVLDLVRSALDRVEGE